MNIREQIKETSVYKTSLKFKQGLLLRKDNVKKCTDHLIIARNRGLDEWKNISNPTESELKMITEILNIDRV